MNDVKKSFFMFFMSNMELRLTHACDLYWNKYSMSLLPYVHQRSQK